MKRHSSTPSRHSCARQSPACTAPRRRRLRPGSAPPNRAIRFHEQDLAALRLSLLSGVGAFLAVDWLLKRLNARAARRICAERQARIAEARKRFVTRVAEIAAADSWDAAAYEAAASEFSAAREGRGTDSISSLRAGARRAGRPELPLPPQTGARSGLRRRPQVGS